MVDKPKPVAEVKPPGLENPDGVIHFLLSELLAKDAIDDPLPSNTPKADIASLSMDVQMEQGESTGKSTEAAVKHRKQTRSLNQGNQRLKRSNILNSFTDASFCKL